MTAIGIGMCVIGTIGIIYTIANKDDIIVSICSVYRSAHSSGHIGDLPESIQS